MSRTEWEKTAYQDGVRLAGTANSTGALAMIAALHTFSADPAYGVIAPLLKSAAIAFGIGIAPFGGLHAARVLYRFCVLMISPTDNDAELSAAFAKVHDPSIKEVSPRVIWAGLLWILQGLFGFGSGACFFVGLSFAFIALLRL
jgi:hypothetical protein